MSEHDDWVARGFCDGAYIDEEDVEHWCRLPITHQDETDNEKHVAPWRYEFPRQETTVRWLDGPTDVEWVRWVPDPPPTP